MKNIVNREDELSLIEEAVTILQERQRLLRTPLIEFYGIEGMGKTSLLEHIARQCESRQMAALLLHLGQVSVPQVLEQTRHLLARQGPAVVLLDALEETAQDAFPQLTAHLNELSENSSLLLVLASRERERFASTQALARKLKAYPLSPLTPQSCNAYLDRRTEPFSPSLRHLIYAWTRGYPLALKVVADAIATQHLDLERLEDQRTLVSLIQTKVIDGVLLQGVADHSRYRLLLALLSLPRRFNLVIMQRLLEEFSPYEKEEKKSKLSYIALPQQIAEATHLLHWDMRQAGYCIAAPVRHLQLLYLRIAQPQQYQQRHQFLAQLNERFFHEVTGADRVRYLREYLYHLASSTPSADLEEPILRALDFLREQESEEAVLQFTEEFLQDEELQEALGTNAQIVRSFLLR
jgi:ATPase family associated with various cellular activities (AAA)